MQNKNTRNLVVIYPSSSLLPIGISKATIYVLSKHCNIIQLLASCI